MPRCRQTGKFALQGKVQRAPKPDKIYPVVTSFQIFCHTAKPTPGATQHNFNVNDRDHEQVRSCIKCSQSLQKLSVVVGFRKMRQQIAGYFNRVGQLLYYFKLNP